MYFLQGFMFSCTLPCAVLISRLNTNKVQTKDKVLDTEDLYKPQLQ